MVAETDAVAVAAGRAPPGPAPPAGPLLLVVDDEAQMRKLLRIVLGASGFRTIEATSGAEALTLAASYNPDLVLLDLGLPDSDGMDVTRRLRQWFAAPILVISARGHVEDKVSVLDAGANDYTHQAVRQRRASRPCSRLVAPDCARGPRPR
ncbi:MAG: response regulator [Polyangiaceae bacterium]|jgi:DNA-binding response OmpR family regulator